VIDDDTGDLATVEQALRRRYGIDYRVVTEPDPGAALHTLQQLAERGEAVALVAAGLHLAGMNGIEFLERARKFHRDASRVLLVAMDQHHTRIPFTELGTLQRATTLGQIDFWIVKGWVTPEEWLYPQVQEALSRWTMANRQHHVVYRIVGEQWSPHSHELRDRLSRNGVPFDFYPVDSDEGRRLVQEFRVDVGRLPAVIHQNGSVLHDPTFGEIAVSHGVHIKPSSELHDLVVVGAGPAGLGAAVYGASEGLHTLVVECEAIGGQAGTSSMIRNYLGFPRGIGGGELAHRAWQQALLFGAEFVFTSRVTEIETRGNVHAIRFSDGTEAATRAAVVAVGVDYRRLLIPALDRLVGAGVFYGAAAVEAPAMAGQQVYVIGGANSAGQAALHLASYATRVSLLVRGASLAAGMSDYLIKQIEVTPNIEVRLRTMVVDGHGETRLDALTLEDVDTGQKEDVRAAAVFVLIGAEPRTEWLRDVLELDPRGFILTARDVPPSGWVLERSPLAFETSVPGIFAVGDVRHGSVKRVAGAVGEGSVAIGSVHEYLADLASVESVSKAK
jgi:thioredoxin reductase (NADPH)